MKHPDLPHCDKCAPLQLDNPLKILHVFDVAGVSSLLAIEQNKMGHHADVLMLKISDKLGISEFYGNTIDTTKIKFIKGVIKSAANYDVIHIHNFFHFAPILKLRYPKKRIIIHYHGMTSAKNRWAKFANRFADRIFVATDDMLEIFPNASKIVTPVDLDHFKPDEVKGKDGVTFTTRYLDTEKLKSRLKNVNNVNIVDREKTPIPYKDMPRFLSQYDTYYDMKYLNGKLLEAHSKTAYEALACGLNVIDYKGDVFTESLKLHDGKYSAIRCLGIYEIV